MKQSAKKSSSTPNPQKTKIVKCVVTGERGPAIAFYQAPNKKWYKSEQIYKEDLAQREHKKAVHKEMLDTLLEYVGYKEGQVFPVFVTKQLKELSFYGDEVILATIKKCKPSIDKALLTKQFPSEYNKLQYIMAILKSAINDVYNQQQVLNRSFQELSAPLTESEQLSASLDLNEPEQPTQQDKPSHLPIQNVLSDQHAAQKPAAPRKRRAKSADISKWIGGD